MLRGAQAIGDGGERIPPRVTLSRGPNGAGRRGGWHRSWRRLYELCCPTRAAALACLLVCVAAPVTLVAVHIDRNPLFSPVDEAQHFDYVQSLARGRFPRLGDPLLSSTSRLYSCHGRAAPGWPASCTQPPVTVEMQKSDGFEEQYEAQQPPLYYAVTAVLRWPFVHVLGMSELDGTRFTGAIWLAAGLLALWAAGMLMGLPWIAVGAAALLLCDGPDAIYSASFVTNDAASIFAGGLVALSGVIGWRYPRRVPPWGFALVGFLLPMLKPTDAYPIGVMAVLLGLGTLVAERQRHRAAAAGDAPSRGLVSQALRSWLPCSGAMLLGALLGTVTWAIVNHELSRGDPSQLFFFVNLRYAFGHPVGVKLLLSQALRMLFPLTSTPLVDNEYFRSSVNYPQPGSPLALSLTHYDAVVIAGLALAAGSTLVLTFRAGWPQLLGLLSLIGLYLGGWAIGLTIYAEYGYWTSVPGRYGLSMAPLLMLALAGVLRWRWLTTLIWAAGAASFAVAMYVMLA